MKYLVKLDDKCTDDAETMGGKAKNLAELCKIPGIQVPSCFCIRTIGFDEFAKPICLPAYVYKIKDNKRTSLEIQELIKSHPIPAAINEEVQKELENYKEPFAVRSSATMEDSKKYSFAGQQDSYLNLSKEQVMNAIRNCWASLYNSRALSYRAQVGINKIGSIGVVVQEMIFAKKSGVIATADPVTRDTGLILINANQGFGETIVSGEVNPDEYYIRKSDGKLISQTINKKNLMCCIENGVMLKRDISNEAIATESCLTTQDLAKLYRAAISIEKYFKYPQDIEFAIDTSCHIVQSRPLQL